MGERKKTEESSQPWEPTQAKETERKGQSLRGDAPAFTPVAQQQVAAMQYSSAVSAAYPYSYPTGYPYGVGYPWSYGYAGMMGGMPSTTSATSSAETRFHGSIKSYN